jgi:hypothetical protein
MYLDTYLLRINTHIVVNHKVIKEYIFGGISATVRYTNFQYHLPLHTDI